MGTNGVATSYAKKLVSPDFYCGVTFTNINA